MELLKMLRMKHSIAFIMMMLIGGMLPLAASGKDKDIVIAQAIDLTGPNSDIGMDYMAGAKVYFDFINLNGGINGRKIMHLFVDDKGDAGKTVEITQGFIKDDHAEILFGYFGDANVDAVLRDQKFQRSNALMFAPLSGMEVPAGRKDVFFMRASYATEMKKMISFFLGLGLKKYAAIYSTDSSYGNVALQAVEGELKKHNLSLSSKHLVSNDGRGMQAAVQALSVSKPQAIIVILDSLPAAQFVKQYHAMDWGVAMFGLSRINAVPLVELIGLNLAAGTMISQVVPHPNSLAIPLVREHANLMKKFREEEPSHVTMEGFIAAKMLVETLKKAGNDFSREHIAALLKERGGVEMGGVYIDFSTGNRGSSYVDMNVIGKKGKLLR